MDRLKTAALITGLIGAALALWAAPVGLIRNIITLVFIASFIYGISGFFIKQPPPTGWIARLNEMFRDQALIHGQYTKSPIIEIKGDVKLTDEQKIFAKKKRREIETRRKQGDKTAVNDPHAVLSNSPFWKDNPVHFHVLKLDYADVCALRDVPIPKGGRPPIVSANAVVVCPERSELLLHRRAEYPKSVTYPNYLHTLGGAYWPPGVGPTGQDQHSLLRTAIREISEEMDIEKYLNVEKEPPKILMTEPKTGFVQLAFLGFQISPELRDSLEEGNWEGDLVFMPFDRLEDALNREEKWVPTGKAALLAWLALDAPNSGRQARFNGLKARELFDRQA